ncbi:transcriptional regulator [Burkholderia sp. SRS-W-2-2016]|uniref:LysR substrate-binding domain-containing protein n=1 Tax=Burkholderia sp. SRS-W-2-2016 TaxID=1926878 RepID=UPI00094B64A0|nr:LysR substrate-binding domain-containing protein [Burkholderia sp. SRS-W-2-2016]OLL32442.1 transcriptional regulator [Burkholderia sp. SRS-W-2-2016]
MPLRLPPLPALRFFEAAGRHQSFKLAAAELNVTPSAISHGIVGLEEALGVELFVREPRGISLTASGADYLSYVSEAFSLIAIGTQRLPTHRADRPIALSCAPTFASRWLLPRLAGFRARWPKVNVSVDTSSRQVGFPVDGFDFAIRMSRAPVAGTAWTRLFDEQFVPVCSPAYRDTLRDARGEIDLRQATLIHVNTAGEDWQAWLDGTGASGIDAAGGLRVDTIQLAFEAAGMGLGVALGRKPLVDSDLASGALVEACAGTVASSTAYWLVSSEDTDSAIRRPELADFKRWLVGEAAPFAGRAASDGKGNANADSDSNNGDTHPHR